MGRSYRRAIALDGRALVVEVTQGGSPTAPVVTLTITGARRDLSAGRVADARRIVSGTLGLDIDLTDFYRMAEQHERLGDLVDRFRGVKPPRFPSLFESLANAVSCQQLSLEVGLELLNRLTDAYGLLDADYSAPLAAFPEPTTIAALAPSSLRELGFSTQKARTLIRLGEAAVGGELDAMQLVTAPRAEASAALQRLPGIGRWSAEYVLLRGVGRLEVFPGDDVGARNNLRSFLDLPNDPDYDAIHAITKAWAPYAGMVYFHLLLDGLAQRGVVSAP